MTTPDPVANWLSKSHTKTWLQLAQAHQLPDYVLATVAPEPEPHTSQTALHVATDLASVHTQWAPMDQYIAAYECSDCKAAVGDPCTNPRGTRPWHGSRQTKGIRHRNGDGGRAPWGEERIAGAIYSTIPTKEPS